MVEVGLKGVEEEIEDVWPTFPLERIRRQGIGPQRLGSGCPYCTAPLE